MIEFSLNGKEPKRENTASSFEKVPKDFTEGDLEIENIEIQETEEDIVFQMKFRGGGDRISELVNNFYQEKQNEIRQSLGTEEFGIILDGDAQKLVVQIILPKNASEEKKQTAIEEKKQTAINILEEFKQKLEEFKQKNITELPEEKNKQ
jgi:hypothetical protein